MTIDSSVLRYGFVILGNEAKLPKNKSKYCNFRKMPEIKYYLSARLGLGSPVVFSMRNQPELSKWGIE